MKGFRTTDCDCMVNLGFILHSRTCRPWLENRDAYDAAVGLKFPLMEQIQVAPDDDGDAGVAADVLVERWIRELHEIKDLDLRLSAVSLLVAAAGSAP